jgi:hypothetical protein
VWEDPDEAGDVELLNSDVSFLSMEEVSISLTENVGPFHCYQTLHPQSYNPIHLHLNCLRIL